MKRPSSASILILNTVIVSEEDPTTTMAIVTTGRWCFNYKVLATDVLVTVMCAIALCGCMALFCHLTMYVYIQRRIRRAR